MSRQIKFRIWRALDEYTKVSWMESWDSLLNYSMSDIFQLDNPGDVLEQFTGLKDANGKDIYEGDIVEFFGANKKVKVKREFGVVIYKADRYGAGFNSIIQNKEHGYGGINIAQDVVVGNVHTNPELLEAQHDTRTD